jgi:hypothetical protein
MALSAKVRLAQHLGGLHPLAMGVVSDGAGVHRKLGGRARVGRKINATAYLLLCAAIGLDALDGKQGDHRSRAGFTIAWEVLGCTLFLTRRCHRLDLRSAARRIGVSAATLSRAEGGQAIDVENYLSVVRFLRMPAEAFLCFMKNTNCNTRINQEITDLSAFPHGACSRQASSSIGVTASKPDHRLPERRIWKCCSAKR